MVSASLGAYFLHHLAECPVVKQTQYGSRREGGSPRAELTWVQNPESWSRSPVDCWESLPLGFRQPSRAEESPIQQQNRLVALFSFTGATCTLARSLVSHLQAGRFSLLPLWIRILRKQWRHTQPPEPGTLHWGRGDPLSLLNEITAPTQCWPQGDSLARSSQSARGEVKPSIHTGTHRQTDRQIHTLTHLDWLIGVTEEAEGFGY